VTSVAHRASFVRHRIRWSEFNPSGPLFFAAVVALGCAGCGDSPPELPRLGPDAVILSFGDSLTFGTGARPEESYPALLERLVGRTVIRSGVPGELSGQGLERLPEQLDTHQPALLILCHGGNDMLRKRSFEALKRNLSAMVRLAQSRDIAVVLVGVPQPAIFALSSAKVYTEVASEFGVPLLAETLPEILSDNDLKSDAIHPNGKGYAQLAEAVAKLLRTTGAVP
jgi:lysophospholipase L1-like esterase